MAVDVEPLLRRLTELAPRFGRARPDLEAIVSRGRAQDYKGVMQNARLVLETLMRSLVADELKQAPGKAMLEELVSRFRQKANAGIVPPNILAHMGTVQAWGNLSTHDHAGSLDESGVRVGREEVMASLNSMVAILTWYAEKKGLDALAGEVATPSAYAKTDPTGRSMVAGRVIGGRYRLEARLAAGGMGEVYRATHLELGRTLALKLMRPELSNETSFVERFRREAMTASRLGHPHIVDITDSGSEDGHFYFVMEFLDGETLSSLIARGPVEVPLALELIRQIAEALEVAHRAGVVHRDLKPDNVIVLQRAGKPFIKLVDFGVAKVVTPVRSADASAGAIDQQLTTHGLLVGTPQYMAPEQAGGLAVDLRADIYALGLIFYELLTGKPPLRGETPQLVMAAHISQPAPPLPSQFSSSLRTLVARSLAKRPEDRQQTMTEVLLDLSQLARAAAPRRSPGSIAAVVVGGIALVSLLVVQPWRSEKLEPVPTVVPPAATAPPADPIPTAIPAPTPTSTALPNPTTAPEPPADAPQLVEKKPFVTNLKVLPPLDAGVRKKSPPAKPPNPGAKQAPALMPAGDL
ncbi:MAG: protein kinase [Archangium sp.]|nr:protein kinase [Archangium sp.]